jgi:hypothetical protein
MCFAEAFYYDSALDYGDLSYGVGDAGTSEMVFDLSEVPEDVNYIQLQAIDYATNVQNYTLNLKTGAVEVGGYDYGTVEFAVDKILNDKEMLGEVVPVQAFVSEVYKDTIYAVSIDPWEGQPTGIAINLADKSLVENVHIGDAFVFAGELDNYYGCPRLDNAEITYTLLLNDAWEYDIGDYLFYYVVFPIALGYSTTLKDITDDPAMFIGGTFWLDSLEVIGVTEIGDGTRTISVTDGQAAIDIVATCAGEDVKVGDYVDYGIFVPVMDMGTVQLRPLQDYTMDWIEFVPAD